MGTTIATGLAARVMRPAGRGRFDPAELDGLPEPVRRHLAMAVTLGTALATSARLAMRGSIKVGRWLPFRARQVLDPRLDEVGRVVALAFDRWGDPGGGAGFG
jgi:hypothetical protein